jgi:hypothetical protein
MSSTDKTRQQLMASMRKTKAAAANKPSVKKKASQPVRRKAQPKRASNATATSTGKQPTYALGESCSVDSDAYQAGRRVWPD